MLRRAIVLAVLLGLGCSWAAPAWAQPDLGVPFTYDCIVWKEEFDRLPGRAQRALYSAIGSVVFAGVTAVVDLQKLLGLPFDPKLVAIGFFGVGLAASLADYWFTNERIAQMQDQGVELGCLKPEDVF